MVWVSIFRSKILFARIVSQLNFLDLCQNPDVEAEKSMCLCSLQFPITSFLSEEYRRDISLDEC